MAEEKYTDFGQGDVSMKPGGGKREAVDQVADRWIQDKRQDTGYSYIGANPRISDEEMDWDAYADEEDFDDKFGYIGHDWIPAGYDDDGYYPYFKRRRRRKGHYSYRKGSKKMAYTRRRRRTRAPYRRRTFKRRKKFYLNPLQRYNRYAWNLANPPVWKQNRYTGRWEKDKNRLFVKGSEENRKLFGEFPYAENKVQALERAKYGWRGAGDYKKWARYIPRFLGGFAGAATDWVKSGSLKDAVGGWERGYNQGGNFSKNIMGWGDYGNQPAAHTGNQLMTGNDLDINVNQMDNTGDVYLSKHEFIQVINCAVVSGGASTFELRKYEINPGLAGIFPFLSQLAQNFEIYQFEGLIFYYKPTSGEGANGANNAIGKVIMACNYDQDAPNFFNSVQMENYDYAVSCKPSLPLAHGIETAPHLMPASNLYVRTGISSKPLQFTDLGNFFVGTEGIPGTNGTTVQIGELWVAYKIRLSKSTLFTSLLGANLDYDFFQYNSTGAIVMTVSTATNKIKGSNNNIGITLSDGTATDRVKLTFPANISLGYYRIFVMGTCTGFTTNPTAWEVDIGVNPVNCRFFRPSLTLLQAAAVDEAFIPVAAVVNASCFAQTWIEVSAPGTAQASLEIETAATAAGTIGAGSIQWRIRVSESNGLLGTDISTTSFT